MEDKHNEGPSSRSMDITAARSVALALNPRIRKSPFFEATWAAGCRHYTVMNHMYFPADYGDPIGEYWRLVEAAVLWDVSAQRQIEVRGKDAIDFVERITPRRMDTMEIGQCRHTVITADDGGILNDPVVLRLSHSRFWFSIADADLALWLRGLASAWSSNVEILEVDVNPLQVQGPASSTIMAQITETDLASLRFFRFVETRIAGQSVIVARSGFSTEVGYEIYVPGSVDALAVWHALIEAGRPHGMVPAGPAAVARIEAGMRAYRADICEYDTPYHVGLGTYIDFRKPTEFVGRAALEAISHQAVDRMLVGLEFEKDVPANESPWMVHDGYDSLVGHVTSCCYSPRLGQAIGMAMLDRSHTTNDQKVVVDAPGHEVCARVVGMPFLRQTGKRN